MRNVSNIMVETYRGTPFRVADRDITGEVQWEDREKGVPVAHPANLRDMLDEMIMLFPREVMTNQDSIHGTRLYNQIHMAPDGVLSIEDAEWDWVLKKLEDDKVGPRIFGMNTHAIAKQMRDLGHGNTAKTPDAGKDSPGSIPNRAERRRRGKTETRPETGETEDAEETE